MFSPKNYLRPLVEKCSDEDRASLLELAEISRLSVFAKRRMLSLARSSDLPSHRNHSLFSDLVTVNENVSRNLGRVKCELALIGASTHIWFCTSRFGEVDDSGVAISVLNGLRATFATPDYQVGLKELLSAVVDPGSPNFEAAYFSALGCTCILHDAGQLTPVTFREIKSRLPGRLLAAKSSAIQILGIGDMVAHMWLDFLRTGLGIQDVNNPSWKIFGEIIPEIEK